MSIEMLDRVADAHGEVVFVGGATIRLWITDRAAPEPRPTKTSTSSSRLLRGDAATNVDQRHRRPARRALGRWTALYHSRERAPWSTPTPASPSP
jgi:hypothetical protein